MNLADKIKTIENLPGCGWFFRSEARIAAEALRVEQERHAQALRDIEGRFEIEAWRHVQRSWTSEEIAAARVDSKLAEHPLPPLSLGP